jgi:hypothetical protein
MDPVEAPRKRGRPRKAKAPEPAPSETLRQYVTDPPCTVLVPRTIGKKDFPEVM